MYEYKGKLGRVVDGDTIDAVIDVGFKITINQRIRFAHINTPEIYRTPRDSEEYRKGIKSKQYVEKRMKENDGQFIIKTGKDTGKYGRYIGEIFFKDSKISLNDEMVEKGLAEKAEK